jgi:T5SS/PEP-CTERM-associated repeat protein
VNVAAAGGGTVFVSGSGSFFGGANLHVSSAGNTGAVVFGNNSSGTFATINVANSNTAGTSGALIIQSGATVTGSALVIANVAGDADGAVTITGAGSTLTLTGTAITSIGAGVQNTGALNVSNGGTFNSGTGTTTVRATGSIVINGGTYNSNGDLTLNGGLLHLVGGVVNANSISLTAGGTVDFDGGVLHVGNFNGGLVNQGGTLAPGQSLGITTVTGTYFQQNAGTLQIQIGGLTPGTQYDRLDVSSILGLNGTLNVLLANGFNPQSGDSFDILNWFGLLGTFDAINLPSLGGALAWDTSQLYTTGILSVIGGSSFTADFDDDGDVDSDDLAQWKGDFGFNAMSDADNDGDSDGADFLQWQQQLGSGAPAAGAGAVVPEPAAIALFVVPPVILALARRRSRRRDG